MGITHSEIAKRFNKGCVDFQLLEDGDRILIALSGGKDSLLLVRLLAARARIFRPKIEVEAAHVIMDNIPYETDHSYLQQFCDEAGVRLHILHSRFDESTDKRKTRCFLCAWNRRKTLFEFAVSQGFNKVALGHHMDDILTTFLMNITYEGNTGTMLPKLSLKHYAITLIRPLCLVNEADIRVFAEKEHFAKQKTPCPYEEVTRRSSMNRVLHQLEQLNPEARQSLWHAAIAQKNINKI